MFKKECLVCKEKELMNHYTNSYDEPPESFDQCNVCGYTVYYSYYEGVIQSIEQLDFDEKLGIMKKNSILINCEGDDDEMETSRNEELSFEDFFNKLENLFEDKNTSVERLTEERKNALDKEKKYKEEQIKKAMHDKERRKNGDYTIEEKEKISKELNHQLKELKILKEEGIVTSLKTSYEDDFLVNIVYSLNTEAEIAKIESEKMKAQSNYCKDNSLPIFASSSCWSCNSPIYKAKFSDREFLDRKIPAVHNRTPMEKASSSLITGCPSCSRSFVD